MSTISSDKGPSAVGVFVAGFLILFLGFALGFAGLVTIPPDQYASPLEYERALEAREGRLARPGDGYCYWAPAPYGIRTWQAKRDKLLEGSNTSVTFSLSELNAWWASELAQISFDDTDEGSGLKVLPGAPFFAVDGDGVLHISSPLQVEAFGSEFDIMLTVRGTFEESPAGKSAFVINEMFLNSAPIPGAGRFASKVFSEAGSRAFADEAFDPYREALGRISKVEVGEASIRFVLQ